MVKSINVPYKLCLLTFFKNYKSFYTKRLKFTDFALLFDCISVDILGLLVALQVDEDGGRASEQAV